MKKKENSNKISALILLFLLLGIIPAFSQTFYDSLISNYSNRYYDDIGTIKSSDWWDLSAERIDIDGGATGVGAHNWTWAASQDWCTGLGTWTSPYIIENITINCNQTDYGIYIEDSSVYFRIQNCTIFNHAYNSNSGAIFLYDVSKATIHNNTIHSGGQGIYSILGSNFTISENIVKNNIGFGIESSGFGNIRIIKNTLNGGINFYGDSYTITENTIKGDSYYGLHSNNNYHNITGNTIFNSSWGIYLEYSEGHTVEGNHLYENDLGIYLNYVSNSSFTSNELYENKGSGISFNPQSRDNNFTSNMLTGGGVGISWAAPFDQIVKYEPIDSSNTLNSRPIYFYVNATGYDANMFTNAGQIILINCNDSLISNSNTSYSTYGSYLIYCNNITMTGCDISNNNRDGLVIQYGANNKLLYSTVNNNGLAIDGGGIRIEQSPYTYLYNNSVTNSFREGIYISQSNYSSVINNIVKNNGIHSGEGIELYYTGYSEVIGNIVKDNIGDTGISIYGDYCNISNNVANGNQRGIYVGGMYNNVSGNTANYNNYEGFDTWEDYNEFTWNTAMGNGYNGFYFYDTLLITLANNTASNNGWAGFEFENCNNITILDNTITDHVWMGIHVDNGQYYTILNNQFLNNEDGIEAEDCEYFLISNNEFHGDTGVLGWGLNHSEIKGNNFDSNTHSGVSIIDSEDNLIFNNTMNHCDDALYFRNCFECVISENEINFNDERGIWMDQCDDIEIIDNTASFNLYGLWVSESINLYISGNTFNNNSEHGIIFWDADENEITYNTINGNNINAIYLMEDSNGNTITHNIMIWNNQCIVEENSMGNTIYGNTCENRPQPPPEDGDGAPPIPGYDMLLLTIVSITIMLYLFKKRRGRINQI